MSRALGFLLLLFVLSGVLILASSGDDRPHPTSLSLAAPMAERPPSLRDDRGQLLFFSFRTVERGVLYRGSAFLPAAFTNGAVFELMRSLNVREIVSLQPAQADFYAEEGYFRYWAQRTGYFIRVLWSPVDPAEAYGRSDRSGLRAAVDLIAHMQSRPAGAGAVLVHGDVGKDAPGVAVAGYEMWRNRGWVERETLWRQVMSRYLAADRASGDVGGLAGAPSRCQQGSGLVCPEWLLELREDLEFIARL